MQWWLQRILGCCCVSCNSECLFILPYVYFILLSEDKFGVLGQTHLVGVLMEIYFDVIDLGI